MNNVSQGQNFRQRRNNNNYKKGSGGGGGRQDFRRGSNNSGNSFNNQGTRHPELDIVIDSRAAQRASTMRDKYQSMARDAQTSGDRVYAEYCLQHTEHYNRIINAYNELRPQQQPRQYEANEGSEEAQAVAPEKTEEDNVNISAAPQPEAESPAAPKVAKIGIPRAAKITVTPPETVEEEQQPLQAL